MGATIFLPVEAAVSAAKELRELHATRVPPQENTRLHENNDCSPSKTPVRLRLEGSRCANLKVTSRDPSTPLRFAQDDGERWFTVGLGRDRLGGNECLSLPTKHATRRAD